MPPTGRAILRRGILPTFQTLNQRKLKVFDRSRILATLDHSIPTRKNRLEVFDEQAKNQIAELRKNVK